ALALVPLPTLAGHALDATQPWWSALADAVHLLGASVWIGGLVALAVALPRAARTLEPLARGRVFAEAAGRFSTLALASVVAPGRTARAAPAVCASATRPPTLPPPGGVVLARQDGDRAVALSVRRSGETLSLVATILSPNGFGFDGLPVRFSAGGRAATGASCGAGCYSASLPTLEARAVDVVVSGRRIRFPVYSGPLAAGLVIRAGRVFSALRSLV